MKKLLSLFLAAILLAVCLPLSAAAAESYDVFVGGVEVTSANASGVTGTNISGKVSYDPATATLTLEDALVNGRPGDGMLGGAAIYAENDLTIRSVGVNTVTAGNFESMSFGIVGMKSLAFEGTGSVKIVVPTGDYEYIVGVTTTNGPVTVNSGTTEVVMGDGNIRSFAVRGGDGVHVSGGTLIAKGGVTYETYGVFSEKNGIRVTGGTLAASAGDYGMKSFALYCENSGKLVVNGGTVTAHSPLYASNCAPDITGYPGGLIEASAAESGKPLVDPYLAINISDYKYLKVSRAPIAFEELEITGVDAPVVGQPLKKTVSVPEGVTAESVTWSPDDAAAKEGVSYTVTVTVKADGANTFQTGIKVYFNGLEGKVLSAAATEVRASYTFPETHETAAATVFIDVPAGAYYEPAVAWAVAQEITKGAGGGKFGSNSFCKRCDVVTFLWRAAGKPEPLTTENPFIDVPSTAYYYKAVLWAAENKITGGVGGGRFDPTGICRRNQIVTFLWRYHGKPSFSQKSGFSDVPASSWYTDAVSWAKENKITGGVGKNKFGSEDNCKRCDVVTFLWRSAGKP